MSFAVELLGPKGHVYFDLAREAWLGPLERGSARRALFTGAMGLAIAAAGVVSTTKVYGEAVALIPLGLFAIWYAWGELAPLGAEFRDARRIGWTQFALDEGWATIGDPVTCRATIHARRDLAPTGASLEIVATEYRNERVVRELVRFSVPMAPIPAAVRGGDDWRASVTFRMPDEAPASWYTAARSVRWTLAARIDFAETAPWTRTFPLLVYPAPGSEGQGDGMTSTPTVPS
ncbi:MAG: hypothetical protein MUF40_02510 [Gemmatimonadaceae bacterium]|jgi:hypothetical protein|nr:hypothetical protein [Gemmatimonadaceae bacterium]